MASGTLETSLTCLARAVPLPFVLFRLSRPQPAITAPHHSPLLWATSHPSPNCERRPNLPRRTIGIPKDTGQNVRFSYLVRDGWFHRPLREADRDHGRCRFGQVWNVNDYETNESRPPRWFLSRGAHCLSGRDLPEPVRKRTGYYACDEQTIYQTCGSSDPRMIDLCLSPCAH